MRGFDLPRGRRGEVQGLLRDGGARPDALEGGAERIEEHLHREGYRDAVVRYRTESDGALERVVYEVTPGTAGHGGGRGDPRAPPSSWAWSRSRPGDPLRDEAVEEAARALRDALRAKGHADAKVEAVVRDGGGQLPVVFRVEPGPATVVAEVGVGRPRRPRRLEQHRAAPAGGRALRGPHRGRRPEPHPLRLPERRVPRRRGRSRARSSAKTGRRSSVILHVTPGPRALAGQIIVTGLERTQDRVVRRELSLDPGQPLSLEAPARRAEAAVRPRPLRAREPHPPRPMPAPSGARDVLVSLSEAPVTTVSYGLGYSERDLFRGSVEVTRRNLFGLDRTLTAFGRVAFRGQRFVLSYREPFFLGRRRDFFGTAFYDDEDRTTFDFTRIGGIAQTTRRFGETRALILRLTYQATDVFNVEVPVEEIDRQFRTYTLAGPSASVVKDSRDNPLDARRGHFLSADVLFSLRVLGGAQFAKTFLQAARYTRLRRDLSLAVSARVGLAATFGESVPEELPLPERFFAGGDYTIRGFAIDTVGPQEIGNDGELYPTGGNGLLLANAELRRDFGRSVTLAAFLDVGNVYPVVGDMSLWRPALQRGTGSALPHAPRAPAPRLGREAQPPPRGVRLPLSPHGRQCLLARSSFSASRARARRPLPTPTPKPPSSLRGRARSWSASSRWSTAAPCSSRTRARWPRVRGVSDEEALELLVDESLMYEQASRTPQAAVAPAEEQAALADLLQKRPAPRHRGDRRPASRACCGGSSPS